MCVCFAVFHQKNIRNDSISITLYYVLHTLGLLLRSKAFLIEVHCSEMTYYILTIQIAHKILL